jgi:hypothetical protein
MLLCRYYVLFSLLALTNEVADCGVNPGLNADTDRNADRWVCCRRTGCAASSGSYQIAGKAATIDGD